LSEARRVLKPGGRALVWDIVVPAQFDSNKDIVVYRFRFRLPKEEVKTGYGTKFPERTHDLAYYEELANKVGFSVVRRSETGRTCFLELRRA
jgi:ubiquinone/menaquinone biosynthesis C-methylase UbiE